MHLLLAVGAEDFQQALAHDESRLVARHLELDAPARIDAHVVLGRLEDLAVLLGDPAVERNDLGSRYVLLAVAAVAPLREHHRAVVDRRGVGDDVVLEAVGVGDARRRVNGMNQRVSVLRTVVSPCTRNAFSALPRFTTCTSWREMKPHGVMVSSRSTGSGRSMLPKVLRCTNAGCAESNEFSIRRNALQFHSS